MKYSKFYGLTSYGCEYLIKAKWKNLTQLILRLYIIYIASNQIGPLGCMYLMKSDWKNMKKLDLGIDIFT